MLALFSRSFPRLYVADSDGWVLTGTYPFSTSGRITGFRFAATSVYPEPQSYAVAWVCGFSDSMVGRIATVSGGAAFFGTNSFSADIIPTSGMYELSSAAPKNLNCVRFPGTSRRLRPDNSFGENPPNGSYSFNVTVDGVVQPVTVEVALP